VHSASAPSASTGGSLRTTCGDDRRDATGHDLTAVVLTREAGVLAVAFTLAAPPDAGSTVLIVELRTADGAPLRRLGVELDSGRPMAAYVIASPSRVRQLDGATRVEGVEVRAAFPADVLDGLGSNWGWVASAGTGGGVDDVCPGDGAQAVHPVVVP
jgi:hypothetical protein